MDDWRLIQQYVGRGGAGESSSQAAFAQLVQKHMKLVYWTCRRDIGDPDLAEDAAQVVFLLLARKASTLGRNVSIAGWLFKTARFVSRDVVRSEQRRKLLEEQAVMVERERSEHAASRTWDTVEPGLNDAIARLNDVERTAILLRYFEGLSVHDVAAMLGTTDSAVSKRIARALDKIRQHLQKREAAVTSATLAALLVDNVAKPIPVHAGTTLSQIAAVPLAAASTSAQVALLYKGVNAAIRAARLKAITAGAVGLVVLGGGTVESLRWFRSHPPQSSSLSVAVPPAPRGSTNPTAPVKVANADLGIVICDPVKAKETDDNAWAFGTGCGRWLQFVVGGRGELGKTPSQDDIKSVSMDLASGQKYLRLTPDTARRLGTALGVPYVATGTIQGDAGKCVLTYTLWKLPLMTKDGSPLVLAGTETQVRNQLPKVAVQLLKRLNVLGAQIAAVPPVSDLYEAGMVPWQSSPSQDLTDKLTTIADSDPWVAVTLLNDNLPISAIAQNGLFDLSDNVIALYAMTGTPSLITPQFTQALDVQQQHFPNSYIIASAEARRFSDARDLQSELTVAQQLPQDAPRNPWSYQRYGEALSGMAQNIMDRYYNSVPASVQSQASALSQSAEQTSRHAVSMLPNDPNLMLWYARAAIYNDDVNSATQAIWKSIDLDPKAQNAVMSYWWAMEMFESQMTAGQPDQLIKVIGKIEANDALFDRSCIDIINAMSHTGLSGPLLTKAQQRVDEVAASPNPFPYTLETIAVYYEEINRDSDAGLAYQRAAGLLPYNAEAQRKYGMYLFRHKNYPAAEAELRQANTLSPNDPATLDDLGVALMQENKYADAKPFLDHYLELYPNSDLGHDALGDDLQQLGDHAGADREWHKTIALNPGGSAAQDAQQGLNKYQ